MRGVGAESNWCQIDTSCRSSGLVVNGSWLSFDLRFTGLLVHRFFRFKWVGCQLLWDWSDLFVKPFEMSIDLKFKWFGCQLIRNSSGWVVNWFGIQVTWLSTDVWLNWFWLSLVWDSNGLVVNWFEIQGNWLSIDLRFKWFGCRLIWNWSDLTSELQYVSKIFKGMLQKYCACHGKVEPRHTNSCNCHAKWSLQSNTSVTWNLQPFHGFCVGGFKHRHRKARNPCACHAIRIVSEPLLIPHACQRFCNPHKLLRLPRILKRIEIPAPATRKPLWTSKSGPRPWCFNDFDFQIVLARRRGANLGVFNFQKCSEALSF